MLIQYRATGHKRDVPAMIGDRLCRRRIADEVETAPSEPETKVAMTYVTRDVVAEAPQASQDVSPRTGLPKRTYRRRDMTAEE
jgi:hypothetical protein